MRPVTPCRGARFQPRLEALEDRTLLAVSVLADAVVRVVNDHVLGTNLVSFDSELDTAQTVQRVQNAGLRMFRISDGMGEHLFHFASPPSFPEASTAAIMSQLVVNAGGTALVQLGYGSHSPQEAAAYLSYLNGTPDNLTDLGSGDIWVNGAWQPRDWETAGFWAGLRAANPLVNDDGYNFLRIGRAQPFGWDYFEVGNELYFDNAVDRHNPPRDPATYIQFVRQFETLANQIDATIKIGIHVGSPNNFLNNKWNLPLFQQCVQQGFVPDFLSDHHYMYDNIELANMANPDDRLLRNTANDPAAVDFAGGPLSWAGRAQAFRTLLQQNFGAAAANIELLATEFNSMAGFGGDTTKQMTSLVNGLFVADAIGGVLQTEYNAALLWNLRNTFYNERPDDARFYGWRTGGDYGMLGAANGDLPESDPYVAYPTYFAEQLLSKMVHTGDTVVTATSDDSFLSAYAVRQQNGHLALLVINKSRDNNITPTFTLNGFTPANQATLWRYGKTEDNAQRDSADGAAALFNSTPNLNIVGGQNPTFTFTFPSYSMTVLDLVPANPNSPGAFQFSTANYVVQEGGVSAIITVSRTGGTSGPASVRYTTSDDTALAGSDYTTTTGILSFANGDVFKTFTVPITSDAELEVDERINLTLSDAVGAGLAAQTTAVLNIDDDDTPFLDLDTLNGTNGVFIRGGAADDYAGWSVRAAGDVNGDGFDDFLIGVPFANTDAVTEPGKSYVIFGRAEGGFLSPLNLGALTADVGFSITGVGGLNNRVGWSVSGGGDVNGDGFDDLVIGDPFANSGGRLYAGQCFVVFGRASGFGSNLDLAQLNGSNGFRIDGEAAGDRFGFSVSGAGDVNGDGFDDVIIGAPRADLGAAPAIRTDAGKSYVIFGKAGGFTNITNLAALPLTQGFRLEGVLAQDYLGVAVSGAGDVNGDGFDDIVVGAENALVAPNSGGGETYVVFGRGSFLAQPDVGALNGNDGFRAQGSPQGLRSGREVGGAGDVNGDGFADVLIGTNNNGVGQDAFVVFGHAGAFATPLALSSLNGVNGFRIDFQQADNAFDQSLRPAGDVNGDGFDDLILGAPHANPTGKVEGGRSYLIFGRSVGFGASLDLGALTATSGFRMDGLTAADQLGRSVSGVGDVNGDGFADFLLGAATANRITGQRTGEAYLVFGRDFTQQVTHPGTAGVDNLLGDAQANRVVAGRAGDEVTPGGGADVVYAGQGDDVIRLSSSSFRRLDGGGGRDTVRLEGAPFVLNLTALARGALRDVEVIDLTANAAFGLQLTPQDVLRLSSSGNKLVVKRAADGQVNLAGWVPAGSEQIDGQFYLRFIQGQAVLAVTDFNPPAPSLAVLPRGLAARLKLEKVGRKRKLVVIITYVDTGEVKLKKVSPLQRELYTAIRALVQDNNGDGRGETVVVVGKKNNRTSMRTVDG